MKNSTRSILPALFVVGGGLASTPAAAIELGEINVQSTLGQPLRASIAYALGPNEQLADYCVSLKPRFAADGLPAITQAGVRVADGVITLTGKTVLREPLMTVRVDIACQYTAKISRQYMLFIDPSQPVQATVGAASVGGDSSQDRAASSAPTNVPDRAASSAPTTAPVRAASSAPTAAVVNREPIDGSARYRVQAGDSLSVIAQRIENRSVDLWSAVAQIFDANPDAFLNNDPNLLKAGTWLVIPDFVAQAAFVERAASSAPENPTAPVAEPVSQETVATVYPSISDTSETNQIAKPVETVEPVVTDDTAVLEPAIIPAMADLQPGDIILDDANPVVESVEVAPTEILDTELDAPSIASTPNVPVANIITVDEPAEATSNWLLWLASGGVALIIGLLVFGRRGRNVPAPAAATSPPMRRHSDGNTEQLKSLGNPDFDLEDDSPTHENLVLDADLEIGTGLENGTDVDVAQDFGFAVTTHLDLELPEEAASTEDEPGTDIIAPPSIDASSILKSEVLPDDDDYDMSVIIDATKIPRPEEVTERDLMAVVVDSNDETLISDDYTVSKEVDYDIVEQDYEDEFTATQALNIEIERAAAEIAERMETEEGSGDVTSEKPLATVTELDVTANLPAGNDDEIGDIDDTGINQELTEEMVAVEKTAEMPAAGADETVEMTVESGTVDTKAS